MSTDDEEIHTIVMDLIVAEMMRRCFNNDITVCNNTVLDAHADGVGKSFVFSTCSKDSFPRPVGKLVSALA